MVTINVINTLCLCCTILKLVASKGQDHRLLFTALLISLVRLYFIFCRSIRKLLGN